MATLRIVTGITLKEKLKTISQRAELGEGFASSNTCLHDINSNTREIARVDKQMRVMALLQ